MAATSAPRMIVIDGLDEAGDAPFEIAKDFVDPLARYAQVWSHRARSPGAAKPGPTLLESLGVADAARSTSTTTRTATDHDVHDYVVARLTRRATGRGWTGDGPGRRSRTRSSDSRAARGRQRRPVPPRPHPDLAADRRARSTRRTPHGAATVRRPSRRRSTTTSPRGAPLERGRRAAATRGATNCSPRSRTRTGPGFPAEDVWPAVATALSPTGTPYDRLDAFWALERVRPLRHRVEPYRPGGVPPAPALAGHAATHEGDRATAAERSPRCLRATPREAGRAADHPYLWHATHGATRVDGGGRWAESTRLGNRLVHDRRRSCSRRTWPAR